MTLRFIAKETKTDPQTGDTYTRTTYTIEKYSVNVLESHYTDGTSQRTIECNPTRTPGERNYLPEIHYRRGWLEAGDTPFEIQTTSYGALDTDEFKKFLAAQQTAFSVAETLARELDGPAEGRFAIMAVPPITTSRHWDMDSVRCACIKNNLYTHGSNESYSRMLRLTDAIPPTEENIYKIAEDINRHSEGQTITNIMFILENEAITTTFEIGSSE